MLVRIETNFKLLSIYYTFVNGMNLVAVIILLTVHIMFTKIKIYKTERFKIVLNLPQIMTT